MRISGLQVSSTMAVLAAVSLLVAAVPVKPAYPQDENIKVSCYKGNTDEGNYVGELSVNNVFNSARECNLEYDVCQGKCLGCAVDSNFNQVCYDKDGKKASQSKANLKKQPPGGPTP